MASNQRRVTDEKQRSGSGKRKRHSMSDLSSAIREWSFASGNHRPWRSRTLTRGGAEDSGPVTQPPTPGHQKHLSLDSLSFGDHRDLAMASPVLGFSGRNHSPLCLYSRDEECQEAVRGWEAAVDLLGESLRATLQDTYSDWNKDVTPQGFERICWDMTARRNAISSMRGSDLASTRLVNTDIFISKYDVRFRNYDEIRRDLATVRGLLSTSGIPQERTVVERRISSEGDAMLEFANIEGEKQQQHPVLRFRVSSHCLRETSSPIFSHMFKPTVGDPTPNRKVRISDLDMDGDIRPSLPPPPTRHICADGSEVLLYRMPQVELNIGQSLEILLHAAHNHSSRVPRSISFSQFVALAETCLRYRCTSPLEMAVEHVWLPCWRDKATDDMIAGVLLIAYVFGLKKNFGRLSRLAILHMTDQYHMQTRAWPVKNLNTDIQYEKRQQIYEQCRIILNEYLYPVASIPDVSQSQIAMCLTRCLRGDRACDAQSLGWFMKRLAEAGILPAVLPMLPLSHSDVAPSVSQTQLPERSLQEVMNTLCTMPGPPSVHEDPRHSSTTSCDCDFTTKFRAAIRDIHASVEGLTLADVSMFEDASGKGKKRFWALSKRRNGQSDRDGDDSLLLLEDNSEPLFEIAARLRRAPGDNGGGDGDDDGEIENRGFPKFSGLGEDGDRDDDLRKEVTAGTFFGEGNRDRGSGYCSGSDAASGTDDITGTDVSAREKFKQGRILLVESVSRENEDGDESKFRACLQDDKFSADVERRVESGLVRASLSIGRREASRQGEQRGEY
ncbi:hypothetical protein F5Y17DRAFT_464535 [Xylariaceae sp. FL0594]|nr:hypothetical protein F5Y17DRAFT_464535 [Xylariaceae sp. FL0594]